MPLIQWLCYGLRDANNLYERTTAIAADSLNVCLYLHLHLWVLNLFTHRMATVELLRFAMFLLFVFIYAWNFVFSVQSLSVWSGNFATIIMPATLNFPQICKPTFTSWIHETSPLSFACILDVGPLFSMFVMIWLWSWSPSSERVNERIDALPVS